MATRRPGDLGVTALWLMPVAESPSYHGDDVTDYKAIEADYGTEDDFRAIRDAAHERGIDVVVDLVLNHTSSEHPWFGHAQTPGSGHDDWYVWGDLARIPARAGEPSGIATVSAGTTATSGTGCRTWTWSNPGRAAPWTTWRRSGWMTLAWTGSGWTPRSTSSRTAPTPDEHPGDEDLAGGLPVPA